MVLCLATPLVADLQLLGGEDQVSLWKRSIREELEGLPVSSPIGERTT